MVEEWDEPITEEWKQWTMDYLEKRLQTKHEGRLTQRTGEALPMRDRNVQRMAQRERLAMRASDLAWAWVAHKKQKGETIGEVCRPELGSLRTPQVLWELQAQALT